MSLKMRRWLVGSVVVLALGTGARGQEAPPQQHQHAKPAGGMMERCKSAMADHDKVMAEMKAADERLDQLVAKMNAASGQARIDATSAVVSELVTQRRTMRERMMSMHERMMGHMMEHVQAGPGSMAGCPMMKMGQGGAPKRQ